MRIHVNLSKLISVVAETLPSEAKLARIARTVGAATRGEWINRAQGSLKSTSRDYVQGIGLVEEIEQGHVYVELNGVLPNMVEDGWEAHDLRATVIPHAKTRRESREGYGYVAIPFRHGTPGTTGGNVGRPMPSAIHKVAKHLAATRTEYGPGKQPIAPVHAPGERRLHAAADLPHMTRRAKKLLIEKAKPWHSSSLYEGMIREEKTYTKAVQSQYFTFRTITENPLAHIDARKWFHPGIKARRLAVKTLRHMQRVIPALVEENLRG